MGSDTILLNANSSPRFRGPSKGPWGLCGPFTSLGLFLGKMALKDSGAKNSPNLTVTSKSRHHLWWEEPSGSLWDAEFSLELSEFRDN